ncbi:hypothetical protein M0R45_023524 [Rubus argutus]|uniref:Minus-end-directed kinesin ATPase n=1 Tax=Rubus argutus TaxID=59490 RepID=A0AAW1WQH9_RUBAR
MNSSSDYHKNENGGTPSSSVPANGDIFGRVVNGNGETEGKRRAYLVEWLNSLLPDLGLPVTASDEDLRSCLIDGTILCRILNRLRPGSVDEGNKSDQNSVPTSENVARFLAAVNALGVPRFDMSDLEKGSMKNVIDCLLTLRSRPMPNLVADGLSVFSPTANCSDLSSRRDLSSRGFCSPLSVEERQKVLSESKFQRALRSPVMSEPSAGLMHHVGHKFHELDYLLLQNAPTQRVACLLRKVVQEIERRISTQAEHLRTQNNLFKAREEKYQSRIRVLEALASGTNEESELFRSHILQQMKNEKSKMEEKKKTDDEDVIRLKKEKEHCYLEISGLKQEVKELERLLADSGNKEKELQANSESKCQSWTKKELVYHKFMDFQLGSLKELRLSSVSIKQEILKAERSYTNEFDHLGVKLQALADAAENYHSLLTENRKLFNELQDLKGNIRVYCRIRPFLPGQKEKRTLVEHIGDNGELVVADRSKPGKDGHRLFKFNKVYGSDATQGEVYTDTQPLIRSVLDGYNVCIFAYGQTGSGKTYTMSGPNNATQENWGVNYRALNDLFDISQQRKSSLMYEIGVQMVEIYNEQVRDLLSSDGTPKKYPSQITKCASNALLENLSFAP